MPFSTHDSRSIVIISDVTVSNLEAHRNNFWHMCEIDDSYHIPYVSDIIYLSHIFFCFVFDHFLMIVIEFLLSMWRSFRRRHTFLPITNISVIIISLLKCQSLFPCQEVFLYMVFCYSIVSQTSNIAVI